MRTLVGYHRYDTPAELVLLNKIWTLQSLLSNYFYPQQKLVYKARDGAKIIKKYDTAATPHQRRTSTPEPAHHRQSRPDPHLPRHQSRRLATPHSGPHERTTHLGHHQGRTQAQSPTQAGTSKRAQPTSYRGHPAFEATNTVAGILT